MYVYIHVPLSLSPSSIPPNPPLSINLYPPFDESDWPIIAAIAATQKGRKGSWMDPWIGSSSLSLSIRAKGWIFSRNLSLFNISPAYFRDAFSRIGGHRGWCNLTGKHGGETIFGLWSRERRTKVGREMFSMHRDSIGRRIILTRGGRGGVELWRGKMPILSLSLSLWYPRYQFSA